MTGLVADKFEILGRIGKGGMGSVYKARHVGLDHVVALKAHNLTHDPDLVARFLREARVMARLQHSNIVRVTDILEDGGVHYLVEELIEGQDLRQYLQTYGALPVPEALDIACQIADALAYAHRCGVIHRDIKPNNILLENTVPRRALLADFGVAKVADGLDHTVTRTDVIMGTVPYCAPEQLGFGRKAGIHLHVDGRTDVFSLALVIFEMCEGRKFHGELESVEIIGRVVYDPEPLVASFSRLVPQRIADLLTHALRRDPAERLQSMAAFATALDACRRELVDSEATRVERPPRSDEDSLSNRELEAQIRALERERQRRLAVAAQEAAGAARHDAVAAGAAELARAEFQEAVAGEEAGAAALADSVYDRATDLLEKAAAAFREARSTAAAAAARYARAEALDARTRAEQASAADDAGTLYRRASALESEGNQALGRHAHADATRCFRDARALYDEAREVARREAERRVAEQARTALGAVRAAATEAEAERWATELWREAGAIGDRAEHLYADGQYAAAQERFRVASGAYERAAKRARAAARKAVSASGRRALQEIHDAALGAERRALALGAQECFHDRYLLAHAELVAAEAALTREDLDAAREGFAASVSVFDQLIEEVHRIQAQGTVPSVSVQDTPTQIQPSGSVWEGSIPPASVPPRHGRIPVPEPEVTEEPTQIGPLPVPGAGPEEEPKEEPPTEAPHRTGVPRSRVAGSLVAVGVVLTVALYTLLAPESPPREPPAEPRSTPTGPPTWAWGETSPAGSQVTVAEGQAVAFAVAATEPGNATVRYQWSVDGREQADGPRWEYVPGFDTTGPRAAAVSREVKVVASAGNNPLLERVWRVEITDTNRPPTIEAVNPATGTVKLVAGDDQTFSIEATDPDVAEGDALSIVWTRNGRIVSREASWVLREASPDDRRVEATVADVEGAPTLSRAWTLAVATANRPPQIVSRMPRARELSLGSGERVSLRVEAEDPDAGDRISYRWFRDGKRLQADGPTWEFVAPLGSRRSARHEVRVEVADGAGRRAASVTWKVTVEVPPQPEKPNEEEVVITESEVRSWLGNFERAYDTKDAAILLSIGALANRGQQARMQEVFDEYHDIDAKLEGVTIDIGGPQEADVSFSIRMRDVKTGKENVTPRARYHLEKTPEGTVRGRRVGAG